MQQIYKWQNQCRWRVDSMVGIIIQSRMGSARLPGKSLRKIQGEPLLHYCVARAKLSKYADELVVATTIKQEDDSIEEWCLANGVECFRGSEEDVLDRYYQAASKYGFQTVVRLTADNPFIDPKLIDLLIISFLVYDNDYNGNKIYFMDCNEVYNTLQKGLGGGNPRPQRT